MDKNCKESLNCLKQVNNVSLIWVPIHKGKAGNDILDQLSKEGTKVIISLSGYCRLRKYPFNMEKVSRGAGNVNYRTKKLYT